MNRSYSIAIVLLILFAFLALSACSKASPIPDSPGSDRVDTQVPLTSRTPEPLQTQIPTATARPTQTHTPPPADTPTPTITITITATPTPFRVLRLGAETRMRTGPGDDYVVKHTYSGLSMPMDVLGRSEDGKWLKLAFLWNPSDLCNQEECWLPVGETDIDPKLVAGLGVAEFSGRPAAVAQVKEDGTILRTGPGEDYAVAMVAPKGFTLPPTARNMDSTWLYLLSPEIATARGGPDWGWVKLSQVDYPADRVAELFAMKDVGRPPAAIPGWPDEPIGTVCLNLIGKYTGRFAQENPQESFDADSGFSSMDHLAIDDFIGRLLIHGLNIIPAEPGGPCDADLVVDLSINMLGGTYTTKGSNFSGIYCYGGVSLSNTMTLTTPKQKKTSTASQSRPSAAEIKGCAPASTFTKEGVLTSAKNLRQIWGDRLLPAIL